MKNGGFINIYPDPSSAVRTFLYSNHFRQDRVQDEFTHVIRANSMGFNDKEWELTPSKKRIFCLGDSFTEGIGATSDSTYPKILNMLLGDSVEVLNAAISGSDIVYAYATAKEFLLNSRPSGFLVSVNQTDILDIIIGGGFERFDTTRPRVDKNPWWSNLYAHSYFFRLFVHKGLKKNRIFLTEEEMTRETNQAIIVIKQAIGKFKLLCEKHNIEWCVVMMPMKNETIQQQYELDDVITYLQQENICFVNVLDYFNSVGVNEKTVEQIHWPIDGHYNNTGYRLLGEAVAQKIVNKVR